MGFPVRHYLSRFPLTARRLEDFGVAPLRFLRRFPEIIRYLHFDFLYLTFQ